VPAFVHSSAGPEETESINLYPTLSISIDRRLWKSFLESLGSTNNDVFAVHNTITVVTIDTIDTNDVITESRIQQQQ
jgi:hypothetical protein